MRVGIVVVALSLTLTACTGGGAKPTAEPQTYVVHVDGHDASTPVALSAFFPKVVRVHAGDTVVFTSDYSGVPHTVALGRAVDRALSRIAELAQQDPDALRKGPPPEYAALPRLLPTQPGDANQAAAQPCVVTGTLTLPTRDACPDQHLAAYDGTQQFASSGWLGMGGRWSVRFASDTKPGTYHFVCQVHGPDMAGSVKVVPRSTQVKDPAGVAAEASTARLDMLQRLAPGFAFLRTATVVRPLAGFGDPAAPQGLITVFAPHRLHVAVGGAVSWTVVGLHSIAFNAPADALGLRRAGPGPEVHLSQRAVMPAGGPGAGPSLQQPPPVIDGGSWNGVGFRSSGIIFGPPPPHTTQFRLRFTRAGSYSFVCTVHPGMSGVVTVG